MVTSHEKQELGAELQPSLGPAAHCGLVLQVFGPGMEQPHWQSHWSQLRDSGHCHLPVALSVARALGQRGVRATLTPGCLKGKQDESRLKGERLFPSFPVSFSSVSLPFPCALYPYNPPLVFWGFFFLALVWGGLIFLYIIHMI